MCVKGSSKQADNVESQLKELLPDNTELLKAYARGDMQMVAFILGQECKWENPEIDVVSALKVESVEDLLERSNKLLKRAEHIQRVKILASQIRNI